MFNPGNFLDSWLRRLGAIFIVVVGFTLIVLSFFTREVNKGDEARLISRMLTSAANVENWFYDLRTARFYHHQRKSPHLVILEMDDESLTKVGRWPWTRTVEAKIIDNLRAYGAEVVMFDTVFPEAEGDVADKALADSIQRFSAEKDHVVVVGYGITETPADIIHPFPEALYGSAISGTTLNEPMVGAKGLDKNEFITPKLLATNAVFGFINASPDPDGIFRHVQLVNEVEKTYLPSLGFAGFANYTGDEKRTVKIDPIPNVQEYVVKIQGAGGERAVPISRRGELKLRFFGGPANFVRVPAHEVVLDQNPEKNQKLAEIFGGKTVLFGSSAFGAHDLRHTPMDPQTPGMYMHANLFHALDQNYFFRQDDTSMLISCGLYLLGIAFILLLSRLQEPLYESFGAAGLMAVFYFADYSYFAPQGYFIRLFSVMAGPAGLFAWFTILNVFKEAREKKKIRATFTRYVSPKIVKEMLANPEKLRVGGEKKEITMLFSDVRDFTTMSEKLSPQELSNLLNTYMGKMTDILFETDGTLDKYIGDALVGFWGAPMDVPEHAYQGVKGATQMLEAMPGINADFEKRGLPRINVGIGLNSGEVSVGNMGSDKIFQYTALGDAMNLASRIESLTKYYGVNLMISEFTYAMLGSHASEFKFRILDRVQVKGKSQSVEIYEVLPSWSPWARSQELLDKYLDAYQGLYLNRKFPEARDAFRALLARVSDDKNLIKLVAQAEAFIQSPPPDEWDGTTVHTSK